MKTATLNERFFESTRGRIVSLLRGTTATVNELTEQLGLTDNAVRAHLLSLERDGLIRQSGMQPGRRKPHFAYELTPEADHLFPKAYDALLNQLITVLKGRLSPKVLKDVLREVGRSLAARHSSVKKTSLESRARNALAVLSALGGAARLEKENGKLFISSQKCALPAEVSKHTAVWQRADKLHAKTAGAKVK